MRLFIRVILTVLLGGLLGSAGGVYVHFSAQLPELNAAVHYRPFLITQVFDRNGELITEFFLEKRVTVSISEIPDIMKQAIIAIEDDHFYSHHGLFIPGIFRAALSNLQAGEVVQGGSTITQQLAKSLFLSRERTLGRKIKEALVALQLEKTLTKNRILELYLNQVYFGSGAYGIEAASRVYFSKSCGNLTVAEAALLAGLPKAPSRFSPFNDIHVAGIRRNLVLDRMVVNGFIDSETARMAKEQPIKLERGMQTPNKAPFFTEVLRRKLERELGPRTLYTEGLKIYSPLDLSAQKAATEAIVWGLRIADRRRGWRGTDPKLPIAEQLPPIGQPVIARITSVSSDRLEINLAGLKKTMMFQDIWIKNKDLNKLKSGDRLLIQVDEYDSETHPSEILKCTIIQHPEVEGALLAMDPRDGRVLAWVGGYDFGRSQFDRVSQSHRQPGSAFKPFVYAAALDSRYTAADIIYDSPVVFQNGGPVVPDIFAGEDETQIEPESVESDDTAPIWKPGNYAGEFLGATTLRVALAKSRNLPTIRLLQDIGPASVIRLVRRLGIESRMEETLTLALGSYEVTLFEITKAYGAFPTNGLVCEPMMIDRILDRDQKTIREYYPEIRRAMHPTTAFLANNLLQGVVQHGTGFAARELNRPTGGKTGTTNDSNDAWFIGYTPQIVTGVWVGLDLLESLGDKATGASTALPIWLKAMKSFHEKLPIEVFTEPENIVYADVCAKTGFLVSVDCEKKVHEAFRQGTEPLRTCTQCSGSDQKANSRIDLQWDRDSNDMQ